MTKYFRTGAEIFLFAAFLCIAGLLAVNQSYSSFVTEGLKLWIAAVLPSLFPYFFITAVLSSLNITGKLSLKLSPLTAKLFNTGGVTAYAFFISVIAGYPVGAKIVSELKENRLISDTEAVRASAFCSTSSPMFLTGCVGGIMFSSRKFGVFLLLAHLLSALLTGIIFSFYKRNEKPIKATPKLAIKTNFSLYESVFSAVNSVLFVGGLIALFYMFTEILLSVGAFNDAISLLTKLTGDKRIAKSVILGFFECTKGLKTLAEGGITLLSLPVSCLTCGFGGISVICQSLAYLKKAKIKTAPFLLAKTLCGTLGFIFGSIFTLLFF